ncbi:MAG: hypothetical protein AB7U73_13835 [Pirellulales bacterium]
MLVVEPPVEAASKSKPLAAGLAALRAGARPGGGGVAPRLAAGAGTAGARADRAGAAGREGGAGREGVAGAARLGKTGAVGGRPGGLAATAGRPATGRLPAPGLGARTVLDVNVVSLIETSEIDTASPPLSSGKTTARGVAAGTWISPPQ